MKLDISKPDESYRQQYESADKDRALLTGLLIGLVAGLLWSTITT